MRPEDVDRKVWVLAEAMMTLTAWLAQTHVFRQQDVDKMHEILKSLLLCPSCGKLRDSPTAAARFCSDAFHVGGAAHGDTTS